MPAPGDQHKEWVNPFEEVKPRVSEWTGKNIATIASRLERQLGPEYISARSGPGGTRVHYLTAEKCITLANEIFGFNGWSSSIQNIQVDFADENPQTQRVSIGLSVIVRVTLRDGTYHEDIGYGSIENAKGKAMAFEKAKKEGTTDGLKRALRNFGNVLGNCIYDKDYVKQVTKLKAEPVKKFDPNNLHRHADYVKKELQAIEASTVVATNSGSSTVASGAVKIEPMESFDDDFLGELDEADFCVPDEGHPDEIVLPSVLQTSHDNKSAPSKGRPAPQPAAGQPSRPIAGNNQHPITPKPPQYQAKPSNAPQARPQPAAPTRESSNPPMPPPQAPAGNPSEPVAFFSARSTLGETNNQSGGQPKQLFNPKSESPSIRRTPGIDHTTSKPLSRTGQHVPPSSSQAGDSTSNAAGGSTPGRSSVMASQSRGNMANPSLDHTRRIGAPGGMGSPLSNRNAYKPPTMKRNLPNEGNAARAPLTDIPTNATGSVGDGLDAKRQKLA